MTPHVSITLLRTQSDKRLADLTAAGHDRAFEAIVDRYRRPLLRYARGFLSEARAEEVVQAALVSAWAALRDDVQVRDLRPWLYRIVHNGAVNAMKRPGGDDAPLSDTLPGDLGPDLEVERREDMRRTLDGIAALPERQRAALVAVAVDGRAHAEVGRELGLSDSGVRQLVRRARVSLRTAATVLTPYPAAQWMAELGNGAQDTMTARIAEAVTGAGAAGLAGGAVVKTGAVVVAAGALVAGAPQVNKVVHVPRHHHSPAASTASHRRPAPAPAPASAAAPAGAQPVSLTSGPVSGGGSSQGTSTGGARGDARHGSKRGWTHAPAVTRVVGVTSPTRHGSRRHHGDDGVIGDGRHRESGDRDESHRRSGSDTRTDSRSGSNSGPRSSRRHHSDERSGSSKTTREQDGSRTTDSGSGRSGSSDTREAASGSGDQVTPKPEDAAGPGSSGSGKDTRGDAPDSGAPSPQAQPDAG